MSPMNGTRRSATYPGSWLSTRLGIDPRELDIRRRAGDLIGVRGLNGRDYLYPAWQLDEDLQPLPAIGRIVRAAREAGLTDDELYALLQRRDGMTGRGRLIDSLLAGRDDRVLDAIRTSRRR
jgi:hypothetical protein